MDKIKNIFLDIDGTLTDGKVYYSASGDEMKAFHIKDGLLLATIVRLGYKIVIITGRESSIVARRMQELGITEVYQGVSSKKRFIKDYISNNQIDVKKCCYIGDDLNDLAVMKLMAFKGCPEDACEEAKSLADYVSKLKGGEGAVRDILENLLKNNGEWEPVVRLYE